MRAEVSLGRRKERCCCGWVELFATKAHTETRKTGKTSKSISQSHDTDHIIKPGGKNILCCAPTSVLCGTRHEVEIRREWELSKKYEQLWLQHESLCSAARKTKLALTRAEMLSPKSTRAMTLSLIHI